MTAPASGPVPEAALAIDGLDFRWPGRAGAGLRVPALSIARGEHVLLLGPSGSGKSTLLALLAGIIVPQAGTIRVLGTDLARLSGPARDGFRGEHVGVIFQMFNLLPWLSAVDNVLLPLSFAPGRRQRAGPSPRRAAETLLATLGLPAESIRARAATLSVGQQQRVAAARALIGAPGIILADEPTSALDEDTQDRFLGLLAAEARAAGSTILFVSHDTRLGPRFDRTLRLGEIASPLAAAA